LCDSIAARIAAHAGRSPDALAVADGAGHLTFGELERRSNQLAGRLRESIAGQDVCIGLLFERSAAFIVGALAVMKAGAAYLPLDSSTPADRVAFILANAGAPLLLTHCGKVKSLPVGPWQVIEVDGPDAAQIAAASDAAINAEPSPESLAYVIYTSGSTGQPKGVEITHANLANLVDWHNSAFGVTASDRASHVAGLGFDAAAWEIWPPLSAGASLHIPDEATRRSSEALREWIVRQRITISFVPTVLAEQMLHAAWPKESALRMMLTGADTLHRRPAAGLAFALVNNYGPTECTVVATSGVVSPDADTTGPPSIGRPITNTRAFILDDSLQPVADGEAGELCLAGAHVGRGYRSNPQLTAERFVMFQPASGPPVRIYRTGDRARVLESGEITFLGRLDDQVKIRGYRIELGEIIACLDRYPGVDASAVIARDEGEGGPALVAYIVPARDAKLYSSDLREFLAARLPDYMIPARFVAMKGLPITPNGKLDRAALPPPSPENLLPAAMKNEAGANGDGAQSDSDLERRIAEMVAALLGQPSVNRGDNFFMLGGHSMLGVQLVARIRDTFGVKLTLRQLFGAPTVAALSAEVARLTAAVGTSAH
jgi:amino acid adenylation domain-containing protein